MTRLPPLFWCLPLDDAIKVFGELEGPISDVSEEGIRLVVAVEVGEAVEERGGKLLSLALEALCEESFTLCEASRWRLRSAVSILTFA